MFKYISYLKQHSNWCVEFFSGSMLIRKCIFEFYPIPLYDMLKLHFFHIFRTHLLLWWECRLFEFGAAAVPLVIFHVAGRRTSDAPKSQFQFSTSSTVVKWYQSWRQRQVVPAWPVLHKFTVHINIYSRLFSDFSAYFVKVMNHWWPCDFGIDC